MDTLLILTGFFCCALTSLSLGLVIIRLLKVEAGKTESLALGYIAGSAANSLMILGLGLAGALSKNIFAGITILSLLVLWKQREWFANPAGTSEKEPSLPSWSRALLFLVIAPYCVIYFRQAMSPEMSPDATAYHLGLVNLWVHAGRIYNVGSMFAAIPHGVEMLYLFAFTIGRHSAAALIHFSFLLDLALLMYCFGRRFGWGTSASLFAPVLVFASPLFGTIGTVAYIDVALSAAVLAAIYLLQIWRQTHRSGTLIACGLVSGFAVAIKYTAAPLPLFIAIAVAWELRKSGRLATRALFALLLAMAVLPGPYLIRNWIWFDNPIAFFGNAIFPNPWFHISLERSFRAQMADYGGVTWRELPLGLTVGGAKLPNSFGTVFLLTPLCLLGLIWSRSRTITLAALAMASVYAAHKDPRFLMPAIPLATLAVAYVLGRIPRASVLLGAIAALHLVISWPALMDYTHFPATWQWRLHLAPRPEPRQRKPDQKPDEDRRGRYA